MPARASQILLATCLLALPGCSTTTGLNDVVNMGCDLALVAEGVLVIFPLPLSPCKATALGIMLIDGALTEAAK